jgi:hypothetical protein
LSHLLELNTQPGDLLLQLAVLLQQDVGSLEFQFEGTYLGIEEWR